MTAHAVYTLFVIAVWGVVLALNFPHIHRRNRGMGLARRERRREAADFSNLELDRSVFYGLPNLGTRDDDD